MTRPMKWIFVVVGTFVVLFLLFSLLGAMLRTTIPATTVLHVKLDGALMEGEQSTVVALLSEESPLSLFSATQGIRAAARDDAIVGLVLDIKNPELTVAQLQELEQAMATFRDSGKWSIGFLETAGEISQADGTFALATMADEVVLAPSGEINLGGFRAESPFLKGAFDKLDIDVHVEKRFAYKNAGNQFTETGYTQEHKEALGALLDDLHSDLIDHIAKRRGVPKETIQQWTQASSHAAKAALDNKMVDRLAYWDEVQTTVADKAGRPDALLSLGEYADARLRGDGGTRLGLIYGTGMIHRGTSSQGPGGEPSMGSDTITKAFRDARKAKVKGILFRVDSPGGSYVASDLIRREVAITRKAGIPVVVSMGSVAASGGYLVSMDANKIVAQSGTITGSIGVLAANFALRNFFRNYLGITFDVYETQPGAGSFSMLDPLTPIQQSRLSAVIDRIYEEFVAKAAKARSKSRDEMHKVAQGRVWSGSAALEHGLIDEIGGLNAALDGLREAAGIAADDTIALQVYPEPKTGVEMIVDLLSARAVVPTRVQRILEPLEQLLAIGQYRTILPEPALPKMR